MRLTKVGLRRSGVHLFEGLDLDLHERRIGLIGNNGAGKSSLLRLVNGLLLPDAGTVHTCGIETRAGRRDLPAKAGFLFQNPEHQILFPTIGEEISFGLRENGMTADAAAARVADILAAHNCSDWERRPVESLSDGQKQRLCLLAVLAMEPDILLLDEPFSSLDLPTRRRISSELFALPQQIIMASHDLDIFAGFDRIIWLDQGRIAADGSPSDVIDRYLESAAQHSLAEPAL